MARRHSRHRQNELVQGAEVSGPVDLDEWWNPKTQEMSIPHFEAATKTLPPAHINFEDDWDSIDVDMSWAREGHLRLYNRIKWARDQMRARERLIQELQLEISQLRRENIKKISFDSEITGAFQFREPPMTFHSFIRDNRAVLLSFSVMLGLALVYALLK